jgi:glycerophosphoryl diester phosphodiesterase
LRKFLIFLLVFTAAVYFWNTSWRAQPAPGASLGLIAHRGVHQNFTREGLTSESCTASRILPPPHDFIENTVASMQAAFTAGADIVELDVHPTTDGRLAVFHDWTLDCRTDGTGVVRKHSLADLQRLDIGYRYTADGGKTFPLRGKGKGLMPDLEAVLGQFPAGRFLVNFKSNDVREGDMLGELIATHPEWRPSIWGAYGGDAPTFRAADRLDGLKAWSGRGLKQCLTRYIGLGWTGYVPEACRDTMIMVPINVAPWLWGWPNLFQQRLRETGSEIILVGPYTVGDPGAAGIDTKEDLVRVPEGFGGYLWTNRIELIGPLARR